MNDGLSEHDPYRGMKKAEDDIRPEFLGKKNDEETKKDSVSSNNLRDAEKQAGQGGLYRPNGDKSRMQTAERVAGGLYKGVDVKSLANSSKKSKHKIAKISAATFVGLFLVIIAVGAVMINSLQFSIGAIDLNLQDALGFADTVGILELQGKYVTSEFAANGKVPSGYAKDLARNGLEVGQMTVAGDFVRTNVYIANLDKDDQVASIDEAYSRTGDGEGGELVIAYNGKIVSADEFVAAVDSDPKMYAAFSKAMDISARYYYSSEVDAVYQDMGASRGSFAEWESTGDEEEDQESFNEILTEVLDGEGGNVDVGGVNKDSGGGYSESLTDGKDAGEVVGSVSSQTTGGNATAKAAGVLNAAISSEEPYRAVKAFLAVEEPIQQARIDGTGPVHEVMNTLADDSVTVEYMDVETGEYKEENKSILETENFVAAVSGGGYSVKQANNFSRDRIARATGQEYEAVYEDLTIGAEGSSSSTAAVRIHSGDSADAETLDKATDSVSIAVVQPNSELFPTVVGGNRIVEGGSFLSNSINMRVLGSMPSDASTIAAFQQQVDTVLAWKKQADRASLSPFDTSSPNTFLGSIAHGIAKTTIKNGGYTTNASAVLPVIATMSDMAKTSVSKITGGRASAEGEDEKFTSMSGDCYTVGLADDVEGDLYCTSHNTSSLKYVKNTFDDWQNILGDDIDESGNIVDNKNQGSLSDFVDFGMSRESTVGIKNSEICEKWKSKYNPDSVIVDALSSIIDALKKMFGVYYACEGVDEGISMGGDMTISETNVNKDQIEAYSGYVLYDTVSSLLEESQSSVSVYRDNYNKLHPVDNSRVAKVARRSGLSKEDVVLAFQYASHLQRIANYNPSEKYDFGMRVTPNNEPIVLSHEDVVKDNLYCLWCGKNVYTDGRLRDTTV